MDQIRRHFNWVDREFDRAALVEEISLSRDLGPDRQPVTARQALAPVLLVVREIDDTARLKLITGTENLDAQGRASRWEFFFDLPRRRAQAQCDWYLPWLEPEDTFGPARLEGKARPFPPPDSPLRSLAGEGKLLHRQLIGWWEQERRRRPDLPFAFRDSDAALREFAAAGLDLAVEEVTLGTEARSGAEPQWAGSTRRRDFRTRFRE